jgi:hypothetical protein
MFEFSDQQQIIAAFAIIAIAIAIFVACMFPDTRIGMPIRGLIKWLIYTNRLVAVFRSTFLQIVLPAVSAAYFLCLDVWGDKWDWIKDHQEKHELAFAFLLGASLVSMLASGIAEWYDQKSDKKYILFIERLAMLTTRLVNLKLNRFKEAAKQLKPKSDTFKQITQPKDQINLVLSEIEGLILDNFGIKEGNVCITILHKDPISEKWYYEFETHKEWNHTKAHVLMNESSAAAYSLKIGEPVFHACKKIGQRTGQYLLSDRDKRGKKGSAFVYPATIETPEYVDTYIISIVTYTERLCDPLDSDQSEAIKRILTDICKRIDLELSLLSIKQWKFENNGRIAK